MLSFLPLPAHCSGLLVSEEQGGILCREQLVRGNAADLGFCPSELMQENILQLWERGTSYLGPTCSSAAAAATLVTSRRH